MNLIHNLPLTFWQQWIAHFIVGVIIVALFRKKPMLGFWLSLAIAVGKEWFDFSSYGKFDLIDIFFTVLPAILYVAGSAIFNSNE